MGTFPTSKLALASGLLASAFMLSSAAIADERHHPSSADPAAASESVMEMKPVITVSVVAAGRGDEVLSTHQFDTAEKLRAFLGKNKSGTDDTMIVLDGAVIIKTKDGEAGYISNLAGWDLGHADFSSTIIRNMDFHGAYLGGSIFDGSSLENVMLAGIDAPGSSWKGIIFDTSNPAKATRGSGCIEGIHTNLRGADFSRSEFRGMNWANADFEGAIMPPVITSALQGLPGGRKFAMKTSLDNTNLKNAAIKNARISGTDMAGADISGADLSGTQFTDMGEMSDLIFDNRTKLSDVKFINAIPPYPLILLQQKQEASNPGALTPDIR